MKPLNNWYERPIHSRAPMGGELGVDGLFRKGGEFEPFYVPRPFMPQIDETDLPLLIKCVNRHGVAVHTVVRDSHSVRFHQRVDWKRIATMPADVFAKPILISRDGFVIDGNHRAAAHYKFDVPITCIVIEADFEEAMQLVFDFPGTYEYDENHTAERN